MTTEEIGAKEEELNQLYNQKSKAKEYENYDEAIRIGNLIELIEQEIDNTNPIETT
jgi:hypothetical protein